MISYGRRGTAYGVLVTLISVLTQFYASGQNVLLSNIPASVAENGGFVKDRHNKAVIVFVHGLFSGPDAWMCDQTHYWPSMIAADANPVFANFDVYVLKYETPRHGGRMTLADLVTQIYNRLDTAGVFRNYDKVVFVAHSMGGILTQQLLVTYSKEQLADKVQALFLYGTPQEGSDLAKIGRLFSRDPLLDELRSGDNNFILANLDQSWIHSKASAIKKYCAYEVKSEGLTKVVNRSSATRGCDDQIAIDVDHRGLVKPCSTSDDSFTWLANKLRLLQEGQLVSVSQPMISTPKVSLQPPRTTSYSESEFLVAQVKSIRQRYIDGQTRIVQDYVRPYKTGTNRSPFPTKLPDEYFKDLVDLDNQASNSYSGLGYRVAQLRAEINMCTHPTPNELQSDQREFGIADMKALRPVKVELIGFNKANYERFAPIIQYLDKLHAKLGDLKCD